MKPSTIEEAAALAVREIDVLREALADILAAYTRSLTVRECQQIAEKAFHDAPDSYLRAFVRPS